MKKLKIVLRRFAKAFISGGIGAVGLLLAQGITLRNLADAQHLGLIALAAFISGGLLAIQKLYSYQSLQ